MNKEFKRFILFVWNANPDRGNTLVCGPWEDDVVDSFDTFNEAWAAATDPVRAKSWPSMYGQDIFDCEARRLVWSLKAR